eukprot:GILK01007416.1.p1 GENE.GILK01007416.1~~GILK01007416.1.p1  ORF type:complete len:367 (+),score=54.06 GILK01007416.1:83-1183(+)
MSGRNLFAAALARTSTGGQTISLIQPAIPADPSLATVQAAPLPSQVQQPILIPRPIPPSVPPVARPIVTESTAASEKTNPSRKRTTRSATNDGSTTAAANDVVSTEPKKLTMVDIIRNTREGLPTKAALEKMEQRKLKRQKSNVDEKAIEEAKRKKEEEELRKKEEEERKRQEEEQRKAASSKNPQGMSFAPKLQLVNGKIVVDASSLVVTAEAPKSDTVVEYEVVHESTSRVTSASFIKRTPNNRWTDEETDKFYAAIQQYGTDFSMIEKVIGNRNRRQIANKFKREERVAPHRLDRALSNRLPLELTHFESIYGKIGEKAVTLAEDAGTNTVAQEPPSAAAVDLSATAQTQQLTDVEPNDDMMT